MMWKHFLAWFPMVAIAVGNGALRQLWYGRFLDELAAHQVSTLLGLILLGLYMRAVLRRWPPGSAARASGVGLMWLGLTVAFEFIFMHYAAGAPWDKLLADYNLLAGRVWVTVPLWVGAAPYVFFRLDRRRL
jgi:hypothetical protein